MVLTFGVADLNAHTPTHPYLLNMSKIQKLAITLLLAVLVIAFSIYGVWEDKMTFVAPLLMLVYAAVTLWVLAAYRSRGVSECRGEKALPYTHTSLLQYIQIPPGGGMLFLFWLYSAFMIPFSVLPYEAKISTLRLGCYVGTYFAAANILSRFPRRKAVWLTVFSVLVFVALYSLVQHKIDPKMLFGCERYSSYWEGGRLGGTYQCPNHIAHIYQMWVPLCLVFLFIPQFSWFWRICFVYAIPLFALLIYQTQSRAGILGLAAALAGTLLAVILRKSRKAFWFSLLLVPLLGIGVLGGLYAGSSMFRERMQPVVRVLDQARQGNWETAINLDFRPQIWTDSVEMIKARPWFGFGPGNYGLTYPDYRIRVKAHKRTAEHPHNEPIELVSEYGVVGTLLFVGAALMGVLALVRLVIKSPKAYHALPAAAMLGVLAGTLVHGIFDFELRIFPNALMLSLLAGAAVAPLLQRQNHHQEHQKSQRENTDTDGSSNRP